MWKPSSPDGDGPGGCRELRAAFLGTRYGPAGERGELSVQRGPPPAWACGTWAVVTAWNPGGLPASPADNARAGAALLARVRNAGFDPVPALNGEAGWTEAALLVPRASLRQAAEWGAAFGQAAVLWGAGARAALVWLGGERVTAVDRRWVVRRIPDEQ